MKKLVFAAAALFLLSLAACSDSAAPAQAAGNEQGIEDEVLMDLTDLTENDYRSYRKQLEQAGFTVLEETSEEVRGQAYVSIGTLLSGETVNLSMSYIPGSLTLYLRPPV